MRHFIAAFVSLLCASSLVAIGCSSSSSHIDDPDTTSPDASTPDPTKDAAADADAPAPKTGSVAVLASAFGNGMTANIGFIAAPATDPACTTTTRGACTLTDCAVSDAAPPAPTYASAGTVTFSGGSPSVTMSATPDAEGRYTPASKDYGGVRPFRGGEAAMVTATGGEVPAFSKAMTYPLLLVLDKPNAPDATPVSVARSSDLELAWSRGTSDVELFMTAIDIGRNDGRRAVLTCRFPSASGAATVPATLLAGLREGATVSLFTAAKQDLTAGDFAVTLLLGGEVLTPSKSAPVSFVLR